MVVQRMTRQRLAIGALLNEVDEFRSAQQLHELLRARGDRAGMATVYRTLQSMAQDVEVDVLRTAAGESLYRRCERRTHHHHLVCRFCGMTVEIEGPNVESWSRELAAQNSFIDIEHTVELQGTCAQCAAERASKTAELASQTAT